MQAGQSELHDKTFKFISTLDIPYVPIKLNQPVDKLQTLDLYRPAGKKDLPVILYLHDGGWAFGNKSDVHLKPHFFTSQGFAFVSMNYRLRWDHKVYDQVVDIVKVLNWLGGDGREYGLDSSRIILMGHAAGAHLVSLAVTDKSYFKAEGMTGEAIKAVVAIDSSSYDITRLMIELGSFIERRQHQLIFGSDENVWKAASPIHHVSAERSLPPFVLLYDPQAEVLALQAKGFAKKLAQSKVSVIMIPGSVNAPSRTDELLGTSENVATGALMAFLRTLL